jgi:hypothetical protein
MKEQQMRKQRSHGSSGQHGKRKKKGARKKSQGKESKLTRGIMVKSSPWVQKLNVWVRKEKEEKEEKDEEKSLG